ncbi:MAG TPA: hypothetical protein VGK67_26005 [Myxococcales bacterium]|jgi:hypothetical protein
MGRLGESLQRLREGGVGFQMDETMTGEHEFAPGFGPAGKRKLEFRVTWGPKNVARWISPGSQEFLTQPLAGTVTVDGLCEAAPCTGTLELRYLGEHLIRYTFGFEAGGKKLRYVGEKRDIRPWNLPVSHTTCFGKITEVETGALVSTSVTHFRLRTLPGFLLSLRLTAGDDGPTTPP